MPGWLRALSLANPLTWHTDVLRYALGGGDPGTVLLQAGAFTVFLLVSLWVAVRMLRDRIIE